MTRAQPGPVQVQSELPAASADRQGPAALQLLSCLQKNAGEGGTVCGPGQARRIDSDDVSHIVGTIPAKFLVDGLGSEPRQRRRQRLYQGWDMQAGDFKEKTTLKLKPYTE